MIELQKGFFLLQDYLSVSQALSIIGEVLTLGEHPRRGFHHPNIRPNRFHVAPKYPVKKYMCLGLYWDPRDYNYHTIDTHPVLPSLEDLGRKLTTEFFPGVDYHLESVLVNFYTKDSSMGLHRDQDEVDRASPIIGLNFGSPAKFIYKDHHDEFKEVMIEDRSVYLFGGPSRTMSHGIKNIYAKKVPTYLSDIFKSKERLNLTLRQVH